MFFILSKALLFFLIPSNLIALLGLLGLGLVALGARRTGVAALAASTLGLAIAGWSPLGNWAVITLEDRFPPYRDDGRSIAGVIVLGGSFDTLISGARGVVTLNDAAERLTEAVAVARRHPEARIVFTGGDWTLFGEGPTEASLAKRYFADMGLAAGRVAYEDAARTTAENAERLRDMLGPKPGDRWLLLTSGYHMPRSVGSFRAVGFDVVAYPVDYRTRGRDEGFQPILALNDGLRKIDMAAREWIGLVAYRLSGRSDALYPAP